LTSTHFPAVGWLRYSPETLRILKLPPEYVDADGAKIVEDIAGI